VQIRLSSKLVSKYRYFDCHWHGSWAWLAVDQRIYSASGPLSTTEILTMQAGRRYLLTVMSVCLSSTVTVAMGLLT